VVKTSNVGGEPTTKVRSRSGQGGKQEQCVMRVLDGMAGSHKQLELGSSNCARWTWWSAVLLMQSIVTCTLTS
jgi:hypothetical protein